MPPFLSRGAALRECDGPHHAPALTRRAACSLRVRVVSQDADTYDENYNSTFRDAMGGPPADPAYAARHERAKARQVRKLSRAFPVTWAVQAWAVQAPGR
jgi:hypothetical protein